MRRADLLVSYNGEIYNHVQLKEQHQLRCETQSDTEVLLAMYEQYGLACFDMIDGMFAVALYDADKKKLILARDRAGEKPLYISQTKNQLLFASELNTLATMCRLKVDDAAINSYLSTGVFFRSGTPYENVYECPAGCYIEVNTESLETKLTRWFDLSKTAEASDPSFDESALIDQLDSRLHESVKNRLLSSDLEVGAFLSGGIDSGLVTAIASQYTDALKTFTVSFEGQFDESALAESVSAKYCTQHETLRIDYGNLDQNIEQILLNYGEPICDDSVIPTWYVSQAAKQHVTVVLTGDGADELFGGYRRYVPFSKFDLFSSENRKFNLWKPLHRVLPRPTNKMSYYNYGYRLVDLMKSSDLERYLATTINVNSEGLAHVQRCGELSQFYKALAQTSNSSLSKLMLMDFHTLLHGALLPKMDIGSMAHSLETRSPFLSSDILSFAHSLNDKYKIRGNTTKYALRELARRYLPEQVQSAPKRGFETSLENIVSVRLKSIIHDYLSDSNAYVRQFYKPGFVDALLSGSASMSSTQRARTLWMIFCVEVWAARAAITSQSV